MFFQFVLISIECVFGEISVLICLRLTFTTGGGIPSEADEFEFSYIAPFILAPYVSQSFA